MFSFIKKLFQHDPDTNLELPKKTRRDTKPVQTGVSITPGGVYAVEETTEQSIAWKKAASEKQNRQSELTQQDLIEIAKEFFGGDVLRVDKVKAQNIKLFWAAELTAKEAVEQIGKRGFGLRNIQGHYSAFNKSNK